MCHATVATPLQLLRAYTSSFERSVHEQVGDDVRVVAVWIDPTPTPLLQNGIAVRAIYGFDAPRVAGLRHWRDTLEVWSEVEESDSEARTGQIAVQFVAHEAAKWARLVLKGHEPTICSLRGAAANLLAGDPKSVADLAELALDPQFEPVEAWLQRMRA